MRHPSFADLVARRLTVAKSGTVALAECGQTQPQWAHCSDGGGEFTEGRRELVPWIDLETEFVMAAAEVLHERMPRADHSRRAESGQTAHRS